MSAWSCRSTDGKADQKIVPPRLRIPYWKGPGADSEEKHEPASDIDTAIVDSLKVLDPKWPIREADMARRPSLVANDRNGLQRMISSQRRLGPEISQSLHSPSAMRNLDLAKCQLGTKPPG
jgi:hypothetical protein